MSLTYPQPVCTPLPGGSSRLSRGRSTQRYVRDNPIMPNPDIYSFCCPPRPHGREHGGVNGGVLTDTLTPNSGHVLEIPITSRTGMATGISARTSSGKDNLPTRNLIDERDEFLRHPNVSSTRSSSRDVSIRDAHALRLYIGWRDRTIGEGTVNADHNKSPSSPDRDARCRASGTAHRSAYQFPSCIRGHADTVAKPRRAVSEHMAELCRA